MFLRLWCTHVERGNESVFPAVRYPFTVFIFCDCYLFFIFYFSSAGGWGKIKLYLTTLPRIFIRVLLPLLFTVSLSGTATVSVAGALAVTVTVLGTVVVTVTVTDNATGVVTVTAAVTGIDEVTVTVTDTGPITVAVTGTAASLSLRLLLQ